jgi:hypothetical protein
MGVETAELLARTGHKAASGQAARARGPLPRRSRVEGGLVMGVETAELVAGTGASGGVWASRSRQASHRTVEAPQPEAS